MKVASLRFCQAVRSLFPLAAILLLLPFSARLDAQNLGSATDLLTVVWSAPSPFRETSRDKLPSTVAIMAAQSGHEWTMLLDNRDGGHPMLMNGADQSGPGRLVPAAISPGSGLAMVEGSGDMFWVGGVKNVRRTFAAGRLSDGYLVKINRRGSVIWERDFGGRDERSIEALAALSSSGDVIVAGRFNERTWIARIAADGHTVWEQLVGVGKGASLAVIGDTIVLVSFESVHGKWPSPPDQYRDDVYLWTFDFAGRLLEQRVVREGMNRRPGLYAGRLMVRSSAEAIYVFSRWSGDSLKPLEVTKVSAAGQVVWRKELSETVVQFRGRRSLCSESIAVLSNGDPVVMCPREKGIQLSQLRAQTGVSTERSVQVPSPPSDCNGRWPFDWLALSVGNSIGLFGADSHCMWFGQISLDRPPNP